MAREWRAQFEGWAHEHIARRAGVDGEVIAAIRAQERPAFDDPDEELAYEFASELLETRRVSDTLEPVMRPFIPVLTHNCVAYVNLMFDDDDRVLFIDPDGGGLGNPKFGLATMSMWPDAYEELARMLLGRQCGNRTDDSLASTAT